MTDEQSLDSLLAKRPRVRIGKVWIDAVDFRGAIDRIERLVDERRGGGIYTPNIDHVVNVEKDPLFASAYDHCSLALVDGMWVPWALRLLGTPLPAKISGSELLVPLMEMAARRHFRVYLLGGSPGAADEAARRLQQTPGVQIVGTAAPRIAMHGAADEGALIEAIRAAAPDLLIVALGAPKQEFFIHRNRALLAPAVCIALGASLDFHAGRLRRAPSWVSAIGLEWLFRLALEPRRLAYRYLVNDPKFLGIFWHTWRQPLASRRTP